MATIGMNATSSTGGACFPIPCTAAITPSVAASVYAAAVEDSAIDRLDASSTALTRRPRAPGTRAAAVPDDLPAAMNSASVRSTRSTAVGSAAAAICRAETSTP
jgi:hypothetical protein